MSLVAVALVFTAGSIVSVLVHHYSSEQKMIRQFKNTPHSLIQDAPPGQEIRVVGTVQVNGEEFTSPLTKRRCVYYEALVEEATENDSWNVIVREVRSASFFVVDKSGRALVGVENLKIDGHKDGEFTSGVMKDASVHLEEFLQRHGQKSEGKIFNRMLRYREGVFEPGETIALLGRVRWEQDPDPLDAGKGYRDVPKRAVMEPLASGQIWATDVIEAVAPGGQLPGS